MEVKFDVIKPNLYVVGERILFGIDNSDVIPVSRSVNEIVKKYIGELKVMKADLEVAESGKGKKFERRYIVPLGKYLDALESPRGLKRVAKHMLNELFNESEAKYLSNELLPLSGVTHDAAKLFGLDYLISAHTMETEEEWRNWETVQRDLADPEKAFDKYDKDNLVYRLDRKKTLQEMKKLYKELDSKIPDNVASLLVVNGHVPASEQTVKQQSLGLVTFRQLKAKDKEKIEEAKSQLVEKLKEVDGPCLSFDALDICVQMWNLYINASRLIERYGDVLKSPMWRTRLFRLDP